MKKQRQRQKQKQLQKAKPIFRICFRPFIFCVCACPHVLLALLCFMLFFLFFDVCLLFHFAVRCVFSSFVFVAFSFFSMCVVVFLLFHLHVFSRYFRVFCFLLFHLLFLCFLDCHLFCFCFFCLWDMLFLLLLFVVVVLILLCFWKKNLRDGLSGFLERIGLDPFN